MDQSIVPDDQKTIEEALVRLADQVKVDLILKSHRLGTGFPSGCDAGATMAVAGRALYNGIAEAIGLFRHDHAGGRAKPGRPPR